MILIECEQNSELWFSARCGVPTASEFDKIITTKGEPSKQRRDYLYKLAGELITGIPEEAYQNGAMQRGIEMQGEARDLYAMTNDEEIADVGFCLADGDFKYGASPDGVVGEKGLIEIKCPNLATHVCYLLEGSLPTKYFQQVQGQLLVTGRLWVDFVSYYPGIKPLIVRVKRDEGFLKLLKIELEIFCAELEKTVEKIR